MFADMIRDANTEYEVHFLLASYIETVQYCDKLHCCIPEHITRLPLSGSADIKKRFEQLMLELDAASKRLDDYSCTVIKEGVHILGAALNRLSMLAEHSTASESMAVVKDLQAQAA